MRTTSIAPAATLLSLSYAATVTLETTPCLDPSYELQTLEIEMNPAGPVARDLDHVCGLRIVSASEGVDLNTISCQAFKDVVGTQPGSAVFTYAEPARIATNPVQEKAIWCTYSTVDKARRQLNNNTVSESVSIPVSTSTSVRRSARSTVTLSASSSGSAASASASASASTTTITTLASASSGLPSSSANLTVPSLSLQPTPSQSGASTSPSATPGAASSISMGMGVVAAALAAMFL
ncbi:hypothetical protein DE146DRAFT_752377 [Phaeosphaeria sp. MPI-PUGE-AT-0046c]|nr:hypothetical protein DE146DRAFT_752377 [Phaeosphaeria sp. MPI-PUGE-AT-0046c]